MQSTGLSSKNPATVDRKTWWSGVSNASGSDVVRPTFQ
uniref:Uncharacterized protein n=1 Tax=Anguilla anguilla TaxID=7936 RepID=A0A0E9PH95_ANGAN